jgi:probable HAF family extracellular repeat protein
LPAGANTATVLPTLNTGDMAYAYGLNSSQQVVGLSGSNNEAGQAVVWTQSGGTWAVAALPNLPGAASNPGTGPSQASAVSSNGVVAGWSNVLVGGVQEQDAVTWTKNGSGWVANDLSLSSRTQYSNPAATFTAAAVNLAGIAVGQAYLGETQATGSAPLSAVEYSGGKTILLGNLGASVYPNVVADDSALGINRNGVVVGYAMTSAGAQDAFVYGLGGNDTMQDMNTAFAASIPAGWSLSAATAIDDNGDIAGYGTDGSAGAQGFLLAPALPGDANLDGKVDVNDLTIVLSNFGKTGRTWSSGDFVGDGKVDINDLTIVLANFGRTFGATPGGNVSAVPEPSTLALFVAIGLLACGWLRRR